MAGLTCRGSTGSIGTALGTTTRRPRRRRPSALAAKGWGDVESSQSRRPRNRRPSHSEFFFVAEENSERDLFGDPVLPRREGPGRPEAVWSREVSDRVLLAFVVGRTVKQ